MPDLQQTLMGLSILASGYQGFPEAEKVLWDAIELLRRTEPRVLTPEETVEDVGHVAHCYAEVKGDSKIYGAYRYKYDGEHICICADVPDLIDLLISKKARLWSDFPTKEQQEAAKWDE